MMTQCKECDKSFEVAVKGYEYVAKYCSPDCRYNAMYAHRDDDESPTRWDGVTRFSAEPVRENYRVVCMVCSRDSWRYWLSREIPRILPKCAHCGGWQIVDYDIGVQRPGKIDPRIAGAA